MMKCVASKQRKRKPKAERPKCPLDCLEEERKERYERLKACAPRGFQAVLEKIIKSVMLVRPIHIYLFIADLLDAEISRRTFDDIVYGCQLKKSQKRLPYPTESCMIIKTWLMCQEMSEVDDSQFRGGPIPEYRLTEPAVDRYRDFAGIGEFDMSQYEAGIEEESPKKVEPTDIDDTVEFPEVSCIAERDMTVPAIDRYRDFAGIGPFEPEDVDDECFDKRTGHLPNCKCAFCTLRAEKSRKPKQEKTDPCARPPTVQTLYIEQPVYREPAHEKETLFKQRNIKGYEPFGAIFQKDEHYKDGGLQPPDPFKEHPIDRDTCSESPQESRPDPPIGSPESCEEETPEVEAFEEKGTAAKTAESKTSEAKTPVETAKSTASEVAADDETETAARTAQSQTSEAKTGAETAESRASEVAADEETAPRTAESHTSETKPAAETAESEAKAEEPETHETAKEETTGAQTEEETPHEAAEEHAATDAAEPENAEVQAAASTEPAEVEPEAGEETKEENPEGTAAEEQPTDDTEPTEA